MTVSILVGTPHAAFGELLRISLEENGKYQVRLVVTAKEARASAGRADFQLAILDADLSDEPFVPLCYELISKPTNLIIVPPDNNPNHPSLGGLMPHGYLTRPFYLPDLLTMLEQLTQAAQTQVQPQTITPNVRPDWATDHSAVKALLEQEMPNSDAVAMLMGQQDSLLGCGGFMDKTSAQEMAKVMLRYWDPKDKTDLMRYVRLSTTKGDYLAYATALVNDLVLIMVFEPSAQLSQVRPQTKQIASSLLARAAQKEAEVIAAQTQLESKNGSAGASKVNGDGVSFASPVYGILDPRQQPPGLMDMGEDELDTNQIDLAQLLGAIPSPDPDFEAEAKFTGGHNLLEGWFADSAEWQDPVQANRKGARTFVELPPMDEPSGETARLAVDQNAAPVRNEVDLAEMVFDNSLVSQPITEREPSLTDDAAVSSFEETSPFIPVQKNLAAASASNTLPESVLFDTGAEVEEVRDNNPQSTAGINKINQVETPSPAVSLLNYTCVLLPRMPQHYLTGELADRLAQWVQHLCLAFGWRLEGISLRPEYLQWTVQVAPSVSPGNLVRIIRQRTSLHIFNTFESIKQQNPSGDFWATGYLIVSGPQPPSAQLLREYIAQTRKRQGIAKM